MTQPNPAPANDTGTQPAGATATAAAPEPTSPSPDDLRAEQLLATAVNDQGGSDAGDPNQLGDAGKRALEAERQRRKAAEDAAKESQEQHHQQLTALQKQLEALQPAAEMFAQFRKVAVPEEEKTDTERLQEELAKLREETATEKRQRWLLEIVQDHNLSRDDAEWLRGETREELEASAQKLAARLKATQPPPPSPSQEPAQQQPADPAAAETPPAQPAAQAPRPDPSQGARGPVDLHAQIADALARGDVKTSIALKQQLSKQ